MIEEDESNTDRTDCMNCDLLNAELNNLKDDFFTMESTYKLEVTKLNAKIQLLEKKLCIEKKNEALVKDRLRYSMKSKENLKVALKKLQQEYKLCKEICDYVEV